MDNYFQQCPPMMEDGRGFTDFRSSQVREELFRYNNNVISENEARTLRIDNGEAIMDREWAVLRSTRSCFPQKKCFHKSPTTRVTTAYNNAEILAYNGILPAPQCNVETDDYRLTMTKGSKGSGNISQINANQANVYGYDKDRCPALYPRSKRIVPEKLFVENQQ